MHLIAYISDITEEAGDADAVLEDIVRVAKAENPKHVITGVLFFLDGKFLQIIEGEEPELRALMRNIEGDARHRNIEYLVDTPVEKRGFKDWNMDSFYLDSGRSFDAPTLKDLTESFKKNLLPRSDMLAYFYKALLRQPIRAAA